MPARTQALTRWSFPESLPESLPIPVTEHSGAHHQAPQCPKIHFTHQVVELVSKNDYRERNTALAVQPRSLGCFSPRPWNNQVSNSFKLVNKWPANALQSFYFKNNLCRVTNDDTEVSRHEGGDRLAAVALPHLRCVSADLTVAGSYCLCVWMFELPGCGP